MGVRAREKEAERSGGTRSDQDSVCTGPEMGPWGLGPSGQCHGRQVRALGLCCPSAL